MDWTAIATLQIVVGKLLIKTIIHCELKYYRTMNTQRKQNNFTFSQIIWFDSVEI